MNPFYFGTSKQRLLGVHHPPRARTERESGILLCYPVGQEYMRAHRAFRQLALLLARRGYHVLRFDYFATGDSAGEDHEGRFAQWAEDVESAAEELRDTAGVSHISLVGLRLGAVLAAGCAAGRSDVDTLVLWDPVVQGALYLEQLRRAQEAHGGGTPGRALADLEPQERIGVLGFPFSGALCAELAPIDLLAQPLKGPRRVVTVVAEEREEYARLRDHLDSGPVPASYRCVPTPGSWAEVDDFGSALIPQQLIQAIVAAFD